MTDENLIKIEKKEIPMQCLDNDRIHVAIPILPGVLSLDEKIRLDTSLPKEIFSALGPEYEEDVQCYMLNLRPEQIKQLGLGYFVKFKNDWLLSFELSEEGSFHDFVFTVNRKEMRMGFTPVPGVMFNCFNPETKKLYTAEELFKGRSGINSMVYYRPRIASDLVLFSFEKFKRFKPTVPFYELIDEVKIEIAGPTFCSEYVDNVAQGILMRNFGVKYLNALAEHI